LLPEWNSVTRQRVGASGQHYYRPVRQTDMNNKSKEQHHHASTSRSSALAHQFSDFSRAIAQWTGNPTAFLLAAAVVLTWVVTGPLFNYSDTWQLVINTGTTIVTFLMVFLIQNTQNRDTLAIQLKLSELVLAMKGAENKFAAIEDLTDEELEDLHDDCRSRAEFALKHIETRKTASRNSKRKSHSTTLESKAPARASS
jgi:low affinity Fe/Cu permease